MNTNYVLIKQMIELFEEFEQTEHQANLLNFAYWIINRHIPEPEDNKTTNPQRRISKDSDSFILSKNLRYETRFLEYLSRIARYHEFYIRKALQDLEINTRLEFLFLQTVDNYEVVKKTDLINIHLLEYTTGIDTIHRLIKKELIEEVQATKDKRVKLLKITEKGKQILETSVKRVTEENEMFFLAINNRWKKGIPILEEVDNFHNKIYQNHNSKPFAEICNLVDSLKHLYK